MPAPDQGLTHSVPQKIVDSKLSWTLQRELWNRQGWCAREACDQPHNNMRHKATSLLYCVPCSHRLTEAQGDVMELAGDRLEGFRKVYGLQEDAVAVKASDDGGYESENKGPEPSYDRGRRRYLNIPPPPGREHRDATPGGWHDSYAPVDKKKLKAKRKAQKTARRRNR